MTTPSGRRVVVTGRGAISPLGHDWETVEARLRAGRNCVRRFDKWGAYRGLNTRLGVPAAPFNLPEHYNRKSTRSMGRVNRTSCDVTFAGAVFLAPFVGAAPRKTRPASERSRSSHELRSAPP